MMMHIQRSLLLVLITALLSGCGAIKWAKDLFGFKSALTKIHIIAEPNANQNTATQLDFVFVLDKDQIPLLPKTGPEWFDKKASLIANQPTGFKVISLQVPPAMVVDAPLPDNPGDAQGVFLYANYLSKEGQYPLNLSRYQNAEIRLKPSSIEYTGIKDTD